MHAATPRLYFPNMNICKATSFELDVNEIKLLDIMSIAEKSYCRTKPTFNEII
jgi:hypothetical protein